ncbi:MAG: hypothetical protein P1U56_00515 [Saprospiraceae bacterium]|nr:hypothetical protein [Saprospiraceae bacterium]
MIGQHLLVLLTLFLTSVIRPEAHEFHMSRTTVNYDTEERAIQISTSIFIDDLELSLKELGHDSLLICTRKEKENAEHYIHTYLKENLVIQADGKDLAFTFLGKEQSDDLSAVWCYLEAYDVGSFNTLSITNTILTAQFEDQKNITMVQVDKERIAHLLFTVDNTAETVEK